jgi:hypothetical protein
MPDDLEEVRAVLFKTLRKLSDKDKPDAIDFESAKVVCGVAQTIINSASVEVRALNAANIAESSGFFKRKALPAAPPTRLRGEPVKLPPSRVVDPLHQVKAAPPENGRR